MDTYRKLWIETGIRQSQVREAKLAALRSTHRQNMAVVNNEFGGDLFAAYATDCGFRICSDWGEVQPKKGFMAKAVKALARIVRQPVEELARMESVRAALLDSPAELQVAPAELAAHQAATEKLRVERLKRYKSFS